MPSCLDVCRTDLFTPKAELAERFRDDVVERVLRIRDTYTWMIENPSVKDKEIIDRLQRNYPGLGKTAAYSDLNVLKSLLPMLSRNSRDFHRWRANEMLLETYDKAKEANDFKTMERAAADYAKFNRVDAEDEVEMPLERLLPQPFVPTMDPSVLGLKPIPNVFDYIDRLSKDLSRDNIDVLDVEAEEADLEEERLFSPVSAEETASDGEKVTNSDTCSNNEEPDVL